MNKNGSLGLTIMCRPIGYATAKMVGMSNATKCIRNGGLTGERLHIILYIAYIRIIIISRCVMQAYIGRLQCLINNGLLFRLLKTLH